MRIKYVSHLCIVYREPALQIKQTFLFDILKSSSFISVLCVSLLSALTINHTVFYELKIESWQ